MEALKRFETCVYALHEHVLSARSDGILELLDAILVKLDHKLVDAHAAVAILVNNSEALGDVVSAVAEDAFACIGQTHATTGLPRLTGSVDRLSRIAEYMLRGSGLSKEQVLPSAQATVGALLRALESKSGSIKTPSQADTSILHQAVEKLNSFCTGGLPDAASISCMDEVEPARGAGAGEARIAKMPEASTSDCMPKERTAVCASSRAQLVAVPEELHFKLNHMAAGLADPAAAAGALLAQQAAEAASIMPPSSGSALLEHQSSEVPGCLVFPWVPLAQPDQVVLDLAQTHLRLHGERLLERSEQPLEGRVAHLREGSSASICSTLPSESSLLSLLGTVQLIKHHILEDFPAETLLQRARAAPGAASLIDKHAVPWSASERPCSAAQSATGLLGLAYSSHGTTSCEHCLPVLLCRLMIGLAQMALLPVGNVTTPDEVQSHGISTQPGSDVCTVDILIACSESMAKWIGKLRDSDLARGRVQPTHASASHGNPSERATAVALSQIRGTCQGVKMPDPSHDARSALRGISWLEGTDAALEQSTMARKFTQHSLAVHMGDSTSGAGSPSICLPPSMHTGVGKAVDRIFKYPAPSTSDFRRNPTPIKQADAVTSTLRAELWARRPIDGLLGVALAAATAAGVASSLLSLVHGSCSRDSASPQVASQVGLASAISSCLSTLSEAVALLLAEKTSTHQAANSRLVPNVLRRSAVSGWMCNALDALAQQAARSLRTYCGRIEQCLATQVAAVLCPVSQALAGLIQSCGGTVGGLVSLGATCVAASSGASKSTTLVSSDEPVWCAFLRSQSPGSLAEALAMRQRSHADVLLEATAIRCAPASRDRSTSATSHNAIRIMEEATRVAIAGLHGDLSAGLRFQGHVRPSALLQAALDRAEQGTPVDSGISADGKTVLIPSEPRTTTTGALLEQWTAVAIGIVLASVDETSPTRCEVAAGLSDAISSIDPKQPNDFRQIVRLRTCAVDLLCRAALASGGSRPIEKSVSSRAGTVLLAGPRVAALLLRIAPTGRFLHAVSLLRVLRVCSEPRESLPDTASALLQNILAFPRMVQCAAATARCLAHGTHDGGSPESVELCELLSALLAGMEPARQAAAGTAPVLVPEYSVNDMAKDAQMIFAGCKAARIAATTRLAPELGLSIKAGGKSCMRFVADPLGSLARDMKPGQRGMLHPQLPPTSNRYSPSHVRALCSLIRASDGESSRHDAPSLSSGALRAAWEQLPRAVLQVCEHPCSTKDESFCINGDLRLVWSTCIDYGTSAMLFRRHLAPTPGRSHEGDAQAHVVACAVRCIDVLLHAENWPCPHAEPSTEVQPDRPCDSVLGRKMDVLYLCLRVVLGVHTGSEVLEQIRPVAARALSQLLFQAHSGAGNQHPPSTARTERFFLPPLLDDELAAFPLVSVLYHCDSNSTFELHEYVLRQPHDTVPKIDLSVADLVRTPIGESTKVSSHEEREACWRWAAAAARCLRHRAHVLRCWHDTSPCSIFSTDDWRTIARGAATQAVCVRGKASSERVKILEALSDILRLYATGQEGCLGTSVIADVMKVIQSVCSSQCPSRHTPADHVHCRSKLIADPYLSLRRLQADPLLESGRGLVWPQTPSTLGTVWQLHRDVTCTDSETGSIARVQKMGVGGREHALNGGQLPTWQLQAKECPSHHLGYDSAATVASCCAVLRDVARLGSVGPAKTGVLRLFGQLSSILCESMKRYQPECLVPSPCMPQLAVHRLLHCAGDLLTEFEGDVSSEAAQQWASIVCGHVRPMNTFSGSSLLFAASSFMFSCPKLLQVVDFDWMVRAAYERQWQVRQSAMLCVQVSLAAARTRRSLALSLSSRSSSQAVSAARILPVLCKVWTDSGEHLGVRVAAGRALIQFGWDETLPLAKHGEKTLLRFWQARLGAYNALDECINLLRTAGTHGSDEIVEVALWMAGLLVQRERSDSTEPVKCLVKLMSAIRCIITSEIAASNSVQLAGMWSMTKACETVLAGAASLDQSVELQSCIGVPSAFLSRGSNADSRASLLCCSTEVSLLSIVRTVSETTLATSVSDSIIGGASRGMVALHSSLDIRGIVQVPGVSPLWLVESSDVSLSAGDSASPLHLMLFAAPQATSKASVLRLGQCCYAVQSIWLKMNEVSHAPGDRLFGLVGDVLSSLLQSKAAGAQVQLSLSKVGFAGNACCVWQQCVNRVLRATGPQMSQRARSMLNCAVSVVASAMTSVAAPSTTNVPGRVDTGITQADSMRSLGCDAAVLELPGAPSAASVGPQGSPLQLRRELARRLCNCRVSKKMSSSADTAGLLEGAWSTAAGMRGAHIQTRRLLCLTIGGLADLACLPDTGPQASHHPRLRFSAIICEQLKNTFQRQLLRICSVVRLRSAKPSLVASVASGVDELLLVSTTIGSIIQASQAGCTQFLNRTQLGTESAQQGFLLWACQRVHDVLLAQGRVPDVGPGPRKCELACLLSCMRLAEACTAWTSGLHAVCQPQRDSGCSPLELLECTVQASQSSMAVSLASAWTCELRTRCKNIVSAVLQSRRYRGALSSSALALAGQMRTSAAGHGRLAESKEVKRHYVPIGGLG